MRYVAMLWTVETLDIVDSEIEALPPALQARLIRPLETVESVGLENLREPHVKHVEGKLFGDGASIWLRMQVAYDAWHAERDVDVSNIPTLHAA